MFLKKYTFPIISLLCFSAFTTNASAEPAIYQISCSLVFNPIIHHVAVNNKKADVAVTKLNMRDGRVYSVQSRDEFTLTANNRLCNLGSCFFGRFEDEGDARLDKTTLHISRASSEPTIHETLNRWGNVISEVIPETCYEVPPIQKNRTFLINGYKSYDGGHTRSSIVIGVSLLGFFDY